MNSTAALLDGRPEWAGVALALAIAFVLAAVSATAVGRMVRRALLAIAGSADVTSRAVTRPVAITRLIVFLLVFALTALPLLDLVGEPLGLGIDRNTALQWGLVSGGRIAVIVTVTWLIVRIVSRFTLRLEEEIARTAPAVGSDRLKRAQTLGRLIKSVTVTVVSVVALLMVMRELGVDILPMLTGAGIAGVALGFGAQWLVRDLIAGFFLILEDQVRVGDIAVINGQGGVVEAINLRTIILRDVEGVVHVFPNGAITTLANRTRDFAYYLLDVSVDFREDTDRVVNVLRETAAALQQEPKYGEAILEPLEVLGVDAFRDGLVTIRSRLKTQPHRQFEIGRELRRRVHIALTRAGVELPPAGVSLRMRRGVRGRTAPESPPGGSGPAGPPPTG